jgi:hypothetical protein
MRPSPGPSAIGKHKVAFVFVPPALTKMHLLYRRLDCFFLVRGGELLEWHGFNDPRAEKLKSMPWNGDKDSWLESVVLGYLFEESTIHRLPQVRGNINKFAHMSARIGLFSPQRIPKLSLTPHCSEDEDLQQHLIVDVRGIPGGGANKVQSPRG